VIVRYNYKFGIPLILASATATAIGQLCWKLGSNVHIAIGFGLYASGALLMIFAFKFGEISKLHPMLSFSYILSLFLGSVVLNEHISTSKIGGVLLICMGLGMLAFPKRRREQS